MPVGVILNINHYLKCIDQVIFKFMSSPFGTHNSFLCVTGLFLCACFSPPSPALLVLIKEEPVP